MFLITAYRLIIISVTLAGKISRNKQKLVIVICTFSIKNLKNVV